MAGELELVTCRLRQLIIVKQREVKELVFQKDTDSLLSICKCFMTLLLKNIKKYCSQYAPLMEAKFFLIACIITLFRFTLLHGFLLRNTSYTTIFCLIFVILFMWCVFETSHTLCRYWPFDTLVVNVHLIAVVTVHVYKTCIISELQTCRRTPYNNLYSSRNCAAI